MNTRHSVRSQFMNKALETIERRNIDAAAVFRSASRQRVDDLVTSAVARAAFDMPDHIAATQRERAVMDLKDAVRALERRRHEWATPETRP